MKCDNCFWKERCFDLDENCDYFLQEEGEDGNYEEQKRQEFYMEWNEYINEIED